MTVVRHLGFSKLKFLTVVAVKNSILHHRIKFSKKSVTPSRKFRDFCDFQDGGRHRLGFLKNLKF